MKFGGWIPGRPKAWSRVKPFWDSRKEMVRVIDPKKNRSFKEAFAWRFKALFREKPFEGPVSVQLVFTEKGVDVQIEEVEAVKWSGKRGDLDNYQKAVFDALNKVAWLDDKQVVKVTAEFR